ncbi:MAG: PAS domain S-box protein [Oceanibaculum nanhaiense]|nr:PAS domain S-box protein [Oceanibaculum nanhaiense]
MPAFRPSRSAIVKTSLLLSLPVGMVLLMLVAGGLLNGWPALLAWAVTPGIFALLVQRHFERIARLEVTVEGGSADIEPNSPLAPLAGRIESLHRAHAESLAALRQRLHAAHVALESLPDPLFLIDAEATIVSTNRAAREIFGEALAGRAVASNLRHPEVLKAVESALEQRRARTVEMTMLVPIERSFAVSVEPLSEPGPDNSQALILMHELTAMKRTEQMRADFVANASHELRTPLSTLVGFIETLRGPAKDDPEAHERFLEIMHEQSLRMSRLVNDLLSLSRIELNEHTPPRGLADLSRILASVKATLDMQAATKDMAIQLELEAGLPPVTGDEDELAQVAQNLIDNATKYGRPGTPIRVVARRADSVPAAFPKAPHGAVLIRVQDQGEGIPREHIPRLTERFYRVDKARSRDLGGTGLGLAIVKHIVSRHRGALAVESQVGKGSTFTVYLPVASPAAISGPAPAPAA